jgi:hypothetical protein
MQSLSRGWSFLQQAWQMAFKDTDLIKPSIYALIVGFIVSVVGIVPLVGAAFLFGGTSSLVGRVALTVVVAIFIFIHYVVSYVFSGMTVYLIYGYLAEGDGRMDKAWARVGHELLNIIALAAASTVVNLFTSSLRNRSRQSGNVAAGMIGSAVGGILETVWTEASYLILPAMMIEDTNLVAGIKRATQIAKGNLLLIGVSTVGVRWVTGLISFGLGAIGLLIGFIVGGGLVAVVGTNNIAGLVIAISLGALIFFVFAIFASVISTYTMTAYNTCLFLWARDVEKAQAQGKPIQVAAPAPLAAVLA